jgi:hypothetical protein
VQVLQSEHDRTPGGEALQELRRQLEQPGAAVLLVVRLGPCGAGRRQVRQQPGQFGFASGDGGGQPGLAERAAQPAQRRREGRERQAVRAEFETSADSGDRSGGRRGAPELLQQPALADARLAAEQHGLRLARVGAGERIGEQRQFAGTADEHGADGGVSRHVAQHGTAH